MPDEYMEIPTDDMDAGSVVIESVMLQLIENQRVFKADIDALEGQGATKKANQVTYTWAAAPDWVTGVVTFPTGYTTVNQPASSSFNVVDGSGRLDLSSLAFGDKVSLNFNTSTNTGPDFKVTLADGTILEELAIGQFTTFDFIISNELMLGLSVMELTQNGSPAVLGNFVIGVNLG
jgi:hypothetical protein